MKAWIQAIAWKLTSLKEGLLWSGTCKKTFDSSKFLRQQTRLNWMFVINTHHKIRPLTAKFRWRLFSSVSHVSNRLELHSNNNWASGSKHPGPSESDVYSDVFQEAQSKDLLHTARLLMRLDTPLHDNARGTKYAVYYASVVTHTVFENKKRLHSRRFGIKKAQSLPLLLYSLIKSYPIIHYIYPIMHLD